MPTSTRGRDPAREEEFLGALYKGGELLAAGNLAEAKTHLEKAHELNPKNEKAQNLLGLTYFKLGDYPQASAVYSKLVDDNPTDATLRVNLGLVFLKTNDLERCVHEFETATDLEPTHKKAHNYLGLALAQQGNYVKAKEHFEHAGSDAMIEKMTRAIAAQQAATATAVEPHTPMTVRLGDAEETPPPPAIAPVAAAPAENPPYTESESIEVMTDEELPSDVYVVPEDAQAASPPPEAANLSSDWGAQLDAPPPVEEMPVLDAEISTSGVTNIPIEEAEVPPPAPSTPTPAWLTMEAAEASRITETQTTEWVTESVEGVPPPDGGESVPQAMVEDIAAGVSAEEAPSYDDTSPLPSSDSDSFAAAPATSDDESWASAQAEEVPSAPDDDSWATGATAQQPETTEVEAVAASEALPATPDDDSWATGATASAETTEVAAEPSWAPVEAEAPLTAEEPSWSTEAAPAEEPAPLPAEAPAWSSSEAAPLEAEAPSEPLSTSADDDSWATGAASAEPAAEPLPSNDDSWASGATAQVEEAATDDALLGASKDDASWSAPAPSAPLPITVEEPEAPPPPPAEAPAGYAPMAPQRLVDLGASSSGWVQDASTGPFHLSSDGLAVTVSGEMLLRMEGLVAVVGSVEVKPENRRRRGRATQEPFGKDGLQLQRVAGHGTVYLEPGKAKFHAVDLTDHNGVKIDDDGAYLREEYVFAFEEPVSFENGRLTSDSQLLELVHLKGTGRVLLQLDGNLRAMPIPVAAPLVVPLHRVVGWFGRVTPRLTGFGGRGAVELTGEGYALLGAPPERQ